MSCNVSGKEIRSTNYHSYSFLWCSGDSGYRNMVFPILFRCCRMIWVYLERTELENLVVAFVPS